MNKQIVLTLGLLLSIITGSVGQEEKNTSYISKGQWMLGGTMSLSTTDDFIRKPSFSINPTGGYFIGNRWALGVALGYSIYDATGFNPATGEEFFITASTFSTIPFTRYYFGVNKFAPFVEAGYRMNWYFSDGNKTGDNTSYNVGAGLDYFFSPSLAAEGKLNYTRYTHDDASINPISLEIGLQFFLSRNQNPASQEENKKFLERGSWMIGGNINLSLSDNKYSDNLYQDYLVSPMAGYFLTDKLAAGLMVNYFFQGYYDSKIESLSASPFVRYYFATNKFAPFAEASFGGGVTKVEYFNGTEQQTIKDDNLSFQAATGFDYFLTDFVAFETKLSYLKNSNFDQGTLSLQAGVSFFLSRKK